MVESATPKGQTGVKTAHRSRLGVKGDIPASNQQQPGQIQTRQTGSQNGNAWHQSGFGIERQPPARTTLAEQEPAEMPLLSIIVPVFRGSKELPVIVPQLVSLVPQLGPDMQLELILVDDGSPDDTYAVMERLQEQFPEHLVLVKLARNFGAVDAERAGFEVARGDCQGIIAMDLQDPPELFVDMVKYWRRGCPVVYAVRAFRQDGWISRNLSGFYYLVLRAVAFSDYPRQGFDVFLIDRVVAEKLKAMEERNTQLQLLIYWMGYPAVHLPYTRRQRSIGKSSWSLARKLKLAIDAVTGFSYVPMRIMSAIGLLSGVLAVGYGLWQWWTQGVGPQETGSRFGTLFLLLFGLQMVMTGVLGEYLWRTLEQVRKRPNYIIEKISPCTGR